MINYPECEKMASVRDKSQTIGEFLEWLQSEKRYFLCEYKHPYDTPIPVGISIEKLLAEFFDIDLDKVEREKREILNEIRKANKNEV